MAKKISVLFLCVHNSARSQLAEGILRALTGDRIDVFSAGSAPSQVHPLAQMILKERGIDVSTHRSKNVSEFQGMHFDYVITLCAEEVCPVFLNATHRLHWALPDPSAMRGNAAEMAQAFRGTADELQRQLSEFKFTYD